MSSNRWFALVAAAACALSLGVTACGGGDNGGGGGSAGAGGSGGKKGGKLTVLNAGDFEYPDPGASYYQFDYMVHYAVTRPLYSYKPNQTTQPPTPDLASGPWKISNGGKRITVGIKKGIRFGPPVNREIKADDVEYALERAFTEGVANGYVSTYLADVTGRPKELGAYKDIPGIKAIDDYTLQIDLDKPTAGIAAASLVLPASAPVPRDYAKKYDAKSPSEYASHQISSGPYMIKNDKEGKTIGWVPDRRIDLVRNPNWDPKTDYRPAYVDEIEIREGQEPIAASRKILRGKGMVTGDITVPGEVVKEASQRFRDQLELPLAGGYRYVAFNTTKPPFDDPNVRKATVAGMDRTALRQARGGPAIGDIATHFIPPNFPGFEQSGGKAGTGVDFLARETGDPAVSAKYFKAAGFPGGKYEGKKKVSMVCDDDDPGKKVCLIVDQQLRQMGFDMQTDFVPHDDVDAKFCGIPKNEPSVCPNAGWGKDFYDAQTQLDSTFNPASIKPSNNTNYPQLDDPKLEKQFADASTLIDPAERASAYAEINKYITAQAPAAPYVWDKQANVRSKDVNGVINESNAVWDLSFVSLKNP
jgi:peptide/nickel transport system substrate-binding protein